MQTDKLRNHHNASTITITWKASLEKIFLFNYAQQFHKKKNDTGIFLNFEFAVMGDSKHSLIPLVDNT